MAKELMFKLGGADYGAAPVKLERKKIYGWTDTVATDKDGNVCGSAYLSPDDALVIPSGGLQQATVDDEGHWVKKSDLTAYSEDGQEVLPLLPSSFDGAAGAIHFSWLRIGSFLSPLAALAGSIIHASNIRRKRFFFMLLNF